MSDQAHLTQDEVAKDALLSSCGQYRYRLSRRWGEGPTVLWIMLNPSTADAAIDDPTIRRCIGFSRSWGFGGLYVGNLFALRATDPAELKKHAEPYGVGNTLHLREMAKDSQLVMAAWGAHPFVSTDHWRSTMGNLNDQPIKCLGRTKGGSPKHPLYVKGDTEPQEFSL